MVVLTEVETDMEVLKIIARVRGGRIEEARPLIVKKLRDGCRSQHFLNVVADVLEIEPEAGKRGPKKKEPRDWWEIGKRFEELTEDPSNPVSKDRAYEILAEEYPYGSKRTFQRTIKFYRSTLEEIAEIEQEMGTHSLRAVSP